MSRGIARVALGLLMAGAFALAAPVTALAGSPLQITKFSIQATQNTSVTGDTGGIPINQATQVNEATVVNEPYAPVFTQAGGHPWGLTTTFEFSNEPENPNEPEGANNGPMPTQQPKDIVVGVPPGLLGDPRAVPQCPTADAFGLGECPAATQVGTYRFRWFGGKETLGPLVDVVPERGQSAEFAFLNEFKISSPITGHVVRTTVNGREEYALTVASNSLPVVGLYGVEITFWGVPAEASHDLMRGRVCKTTAYLQALECTGGNESSGVAPVPFLTLPTDCAAGPEMATLRADSWEEPGRVGVGNKYEGFQEASYTMPAVTGCGALAFDPSVEIRPDTLLADEPVGVNVDLKVPLSEEPETNATPQLRNALVTLPEGLSVSAGVIDGIQACNESGPEGINFNGPESERAGLNGELELAPGHCPDASTIGTAEAITPLLGTPLRGHVYLARPGCGGAGQSACTEQDALDGNLYRVYLELGGEGELAQTGVHIKVAGDTEANPATGQLTTVFDENPPLPFSDLKIHLNGGPKAPLANPAVCGDAVTTADFTPWSAPGMTPEGLFVQGTADATPSSFYEVQGCTYPTPFNPGFVAGTVTPQAGQFSAFTLNLSRQDREQYVKGIQVHTPPGLLGMLSNVPLCGSEQAESGTCPESSKIGTTRVATGAGSHPFEIEGNVYLTGPYEGDPFGLSIVVHVLVGPFNLGDVVVRARIAVNPENSTLTVTTDETGPHAVPQIVFGVPVRLQRITVNIDRSGFMFNPTNCAAQQIVATISGSQEATSTVASPFAVGGCKSLAFKPSFKASTSGRTSRAKGANLDVKLSYPADSVGNDANIARVKVDLPKRLPSRLTTLQKACTARTFDVDPASCPPASVVGIVRATTPLLPVGLSGPVYFVSHGGEAFPSLIVVLQGDGVRVDLTGSTFISKAGITSSTFRTIPDVPVNTFELYLPQGKYSALAANGNLCDSQSKLKMPTEFVAQNGAKIKQSTKIAVTGCPRSKTRKAAKASRASAARESTTEHGRAGR